MRNLFTGIAANVILVVKDCSNKAYHHRGSGVIVYSVRYVMINKPITATEIEEGWNREHKHNCRCELCYVRAIAKGTEKVLESILDVKMKCVDCNWQGSVGECDCDADYPEVEDDGRLRCPKCKGLVNDH